MYSPPILVYLVSSLSTPGAIARCNGYVIPPPPKKIPFASCLHCWYLGNDRYQAAGWHWRVHRASFRWQNASLLPLPSPSRTRCEGYNAACTKVTTKGGRDKPLSYIPTIPYLSYLFRSCLRLCFLQGHSSRSSSPFTSTEGPLFA